MMHAAGTLLFHMYQKDVPFDEAIQFEELESEVVTELRESDYD